MQGSTKTGAEDGEPLVAEAPSDEDFWSDEDEAEETLAEGPNPASWAADPNCADYAHLPAYGAETEFSFTAAHFRRLCEVNAFPIAGLGRPILFGLRGCAIVEGGDSGFQSKVKLRDQRPDHRSTRCVLGVCEGDKLAVYPGSTVPNAEAMHSWLTKRDKGNLLPTGFYRYIVGAHNGKPGCFLLRRTPGQKRTVIVRRSSDDLCYESADDVFVSQPGDNIHPAFFGAPRFSSFGCQVVAGSADKTGAHTGPWSRFRKAAGLTNAGGPAGDYGYVLLTGKEARLAAQSAPDAALRRLRFGSEGAAVRRLQQAMGLPDPDTTFGPNTAHAWHRRQAQTANGRSDGVFSPAAEAALGWSVFA